MIDDLHVHYRVMDAVACITSAFDLSERGDMEHLKSLGLLVEGKQTASDAFEIRDETHLIRLHSKATSGVISFPSFPLALAMSRVARIVARTIQTLPSAR